MIHDESAKAVCQVLERASTGDECAAQQLIPMLYDELRVLAKHRMSRLPPGNTLDTTALVHETYLRVAGKRNVHWQGRRHFFFAAARGMRDVLVEQARRKAALKRGGACNRLRITLADVALPPTADDVLALHRALEQLEDEDPSCAQTVTLRYFAGLTTEETADVLQTSPSTIKRRWRFARAWLRRALASGDRVQGGP